MKLNGSIDYESIMVSLDPLKTPIAYNNRVNSLLSCGVSKEEAMKLALEPIELELYYNTNLGLFGVESEAVEGNCDIYDPYTSEILEPYDD